MKFYQVQSRIFLLLVLALVGLALLVPVIVNSFSRTTDKYLIAELNRAQAEMYFYEGDHGNYKNACLSGLFGFDQYFLLNETGHAISCTVSPSLRSMSMYTSLEEEGFVFCVDSNGFSGKILDSHPNPGYCSK